MTTKRILISVGVAAVLAAGAGGAAVAAGGGDDHEAPITGAALERASAAALAFTGGGKVTETEVGDEDSYYEVEVTLANGRAKDVQLDRNFRVVASKTDHDRPGDDDTNARGGRAKN